MTVFREVAQQRGWALADLARTLSMDRKTVERWASGVAVPQPRSRAVVADLLGTPVEELWPGYPAPTGGGTQRGVEQIWLTRAETPGSVWQRVLGQAGSSLDVLVHDDTFLLKQYDLRAHLTRVASAGGRARVLMADLGDAADSAMAMRFRVGQWLAGSGAEVRTHQAPVPAAIIRGDDVMLVNMATYGLPAPASPVMLLRRYRQRCLFHSYEKSFERVWKTSSLVEAGNGHA